MKNESNWRETKFLLGKDGVMANIKYTGAGSFVYTQQLARVISEVVKKYTKGNVLDYGCGSCPLFGFYRRYAQSVTCVDWAQSSHKIDHADILNDLSVSHVSFGVFETIICTDLLEHLPNITVAIDNITKMLSKNGVIIISTPFMYPIHEEPHDYSRPTSFLLDRAFSISGCERICIIPFGGGATLFIDMALKWIDRVGLIPRPIKTVIARIAAFALRRVPLKWIDSITQQKIPSGYVAVFTKHD